MAIPPFTSAGLLPIGDHQATFDELRQSRLVTGAGTATWDQAWRLALVNNLEVLVRQLWRVGISTIFIDGSFAEDRDHPNDIDGYFECLYDEFVYGDLVRNLNELDRYGVWTWNRASRQLDPATGKGQLPMWHRYRVELYPHFGQGSGIRDRFGHELTFPSAFRQSTLTHQPKGIIQLQQGGTLP